ncbi:MAG: cyanoexosortase B [Prochlorotrichaceae cyanobacterium]
MTTSSPSLPFLKDPNLFAWILGGALLILYGPLVVHWYDGWLNKSISLEHEYFSHGVLGLPLALKIVWEQRDRWQTLNDRWHPVGAVLMGFAGALYLSGISDTVNLSFPILLAGLCLWLKGTEGLKLQGFPLLLLFFATPTEIPYLIAPYTLGLQTFIAATAGFILQQLHFDIVVQEIYLYVGGRIVEVAPHCAGLKALFTNLYFCMIGVYWSEAWKSLNKTLTLFSGSIIISVVVNILRNTLLTIFHGTGQDALFNWFHEGWGSELYWLALIGLLFLFFKVINNLWPNPVEALEPLPVSAEAPQDEVVDH